MKGLCLSEFKFVSWSWNNKIVIGNIINWILILNKSALFNYIKQQNGFCKNSFSVYHKAFVKPNKNIYGIENIKEHFWFTREYEDCKSEVNKAIGFT